MVQGFLLTTGILLFQTFVDTLIEYFVWGVGAFGPSGPGNPGFYSRDRRSKFPDYENVWTVTVGIRKRTSPNGSAPNLNAADCYLSHRIALEKFWQWARGATKRASGRTKPRSPNHWEHRNVPTMSQVLSWMHYIYSKNPLYSSMWAPSIVCTLLHGAAFF